MSPNEALAQARAPARAPGGAARGADGLARARVLDREAAKAYAEGRYNDAIRYFEESYRLGGPPFELWNIAKCHVRLDQLEQAADVLERYLGTPALPEEDRAEATQQLDAIRKKPSVVTIATQPSGATVTLDGRVRASSAKTPASLLVSPGAHTVLLTYPTYVPQTKSFDASYGRAILLDVALREESQRESTLLTLGGDVGVMIPKLGSVGGNVHPTLVVSGSYRFARLGPTTFRAGAMVMLTGDSWDNTVGSTNVAAPCGKLDSPRSATALSAFATGSAGWELFPRLSVQALMGLGVAGYLAGDLGGDVFVPACSPSPGARPDLMVGGRIDYALTPMVHLSVLPLVLQVQPSFAGTRSAPVDASGVWMRATIALGAGIDL